MSIEIRVPTLGESVSEATIGSWYKSVGESVNADEPIVELETDKVTIEVPAPSSGVLETISAKEGENVEVGALLGVIKAGAGADASASTGNADVKTEEKPASEEKSTVSADAAPSQTANKVSVSPSAARIIAEHNLDKSTIKGTGKDGQILKEDVLPLIKAVEPKKAAQQDSPAPISAATTDGPEEALEERVKMTRLRKTIAKRLKDAQNTAAMLTTFNEVDMKPIMDLRKNYKELFEKKHGVKLGFMGFFTKAVTHALKEIPAVNAEIDGDYIIYKNYAHIGIAVGTDKGLVVPVVKNADKMSIAQIEKEIGRLGRAARDGKLSMADMQGGTFTISNGGVYGSLLSTPILNAPQSGILGMHKIQQRPVAIDGEIVIRPMMYLALSYDHRIVDGKEAVTFLVRVKESLEDPQRLVLDL